MQRQLIEKSYHVRVHASCFMLGSREAGSGLSSPLRASEWGVLSPSEELSCGRDSSGRAGGCEWVSWWVEFSRAWPPPSSRASSTHAHFHSSSKYCTALNCSRTTAIPRSVPHLCVATTPVTQPCAPPPPSKSHKQHKREQPRRLPTCGLDCTRLREAHGEAPASPHKRRLCGCWRRSGQECGCSGRTCQVCGCSGRSGVHLGPFCCFRPAEGLTASRKVVAAERLAARTPRRRFDANGPRITRARPSESAAPARSPSAPPASCV